MFTLKKKSSVTRKITPAKEEEEEAPAFAGIKLKKTSQVKRTWEEEGLETVELKHHEFEIHPEKEVAENETTVVLSTPLDYDEADKGQKVKKKKKKKVIKYVPANIYF